MSVFHCYANYMVSYSQIQCLSLYQIFIQERVEAGSKTTAAVTICQKTFCICTLLLPT